MPHELLKFVNPFSRIEIVDEVVQRRSVARNRKLFVCFVELKYGISLLVALNGRARLQHPECQQEANKNTPGDECKNWFEADLVDQPPDHR